MCFEMSTESIDPGSLADIPGAQLLDVRTPAEFEEAHVTGSKLAPLDQLDPDQVKEAFDTSKKIYVICGSGKRAREALGKLRDGGLECGVLLNGGITAWSDRGLALERGRKIMGLERQVRIAAGTLVLVGIGLSFLNPWSLVLSAFVGAGLVFAGITDTCGMGMLLARMPWNRRGKGSVADSCSINRTTSS